MLVGPRDGWETDGSLSMYAAERYQKFNRATVFPRPRGCIGVTFENQELECYIQTTG